MKVILWKSKIEYQRTFFVKISYLSLKFDANMTSDNYQNLRSISQMIPGLQQSKLTGI